MLQNHPVGHGVLNKNLSVLALKGNFGNMKYIFPNRENRQQFPRFFSVLHCYILEIDLQPDEIMLFPLLHLYGRTTL